MILESDTAVTKVQIHKDDSPQGFIGEFIDLYHLAHTVSLQKYPLKDNPKVYLKLKDKKLTKKDFPKT